MSSLYDTVVGVMSKADGQFAVASMADIKEPERVYYTFSVAMVLEMPDNANGVAVFAHRWSTLDAVLTLVRLAGGRWAKYELLPRDGRWQNKGWLMVYHSERGEIRPGGTAQ